MSDFTSKLFGTLPSQILIILTLTLSLVSTVNAQTALSFNTEGTKDDYVNVPNAGALLEGDNSWTIEFWMKQTSGGGYPFSFGASRYILFHTAGTIVFYTGNGNIQTVNGSFPLDANWHHFAFVSNGSSNATVYVDGVAKGLQANAHTGYSGMSTEPLTLGSVVSYTEESFDEVRIWDYARSGTEITNGMAACFTGAETGLKLYFQFEDGSGTTVTNLGTSGATYNGTMVNMETGTDWVSNSGYGGCDTPPCTPPSISAHPSASSDCAGDPTSFSVTASGTTLTYQWRENGSNISNGGVYSGVTSATLNISDVSGLNGKSYDVVVTESGSCSSTSTTAGLTVTNNPSISAHPSASSDCAGDAASFSVTATGTTLTYQWRVDGGDITNGGVYSGATSATLNISDVTGLNGKSYDVVVTESGSCSSTSSSASLTVNAIPTITGTTPASRLCDGTVTLGATASAGTLNWYAASSGGSSLGTGTSFTTPSLSSTTSYYVDATANGCTTASRTAVTATINPLTDLVVSATASNILCEGSTTVTTISSDNGVNYYLRDNSDDSVIDGPVAGTGSGLSFNTGILSSTKTFNVYGELPGSGNLTFDGIDDFIDLGTGISFVGTSAYTVEARVKADNVGTPEKNVVSKHQFGTGNLEFLLRINNGKVVGGIRAGGTDSYITGTTTLVPGTWYDLAVTYDGSNLKVYVNGVEDGSTAKTGTVDANSANAYIGASFNGAGAGAEFYDGAIEEVRIWNVAKSGAEISSNLSTDFAGNESGLVALYEFSDGSGTTLSDETVNGHNGTLTNMSGTEWGFTTACTLEMTQTATVTIDQLTDLAVSASESNILCEGSTTITTTSSDNGVNYYLRDNSDDSVIDGPVAGDGNGLSFNTGVLTNSKTFNVFSGTGSGVLTFDGTDDFVDLGTGITFVGTSSYTIEARVNPDDITTPEKNIVAKHQFGTGNIEFLLRINNGKLVGGIFAGGSYASVTGTTTLSAGSWYDLAMTYDGSNLRIYVDGAEDGSVSKSGTIDANSANAYIGASYNGAGAGAEFFDGSISEVRIWNITKSEAELASNLGTDYLGSETGLVALYEFSDTSGTTLSDETANGHNGTLNNMSGTEWSTDFTCSLEMTQTATVTIDALTDQTYSAASTTVNTGEDVNFTIDGSETGVNYYLRNDANDTLFAGPIAGTGSAIVINTGVLNETITFNVYQEHTSTSCSTEMAQGTQTITVINQTLHYVDTDAVGSNDGSDWTNAYTDLQSALAVADSGDSVWVAAGTYYPTATTDRTIWFEPADGVKIYGGFAGTETADTQRTDFGVGGANETILSGDIGTPAVDTDNSQHVFNFIANNATNTINGLTIAKGYTNGGPIAGGGIYFSATAATLHLTDVHLVDNYAAWDGAGMVSYGSTNVYMTRVSFTGGYAGEEGGGFELNSSGIVVLNQVDVISNQAAWEGAGGRITASSDLTIINSKFVGNEMTTTGRPYGGGIEIVNVTGSIVNTIISGNKSMNFGGGIRMANSVLDIINCTIVANEATGNGGGISISGGTLNLKNTIIWDNEHSNITGDQSASIYQEAAATINYTNSLVEAYNPGGNNLDGTNAGNDPLFTTAVDLSVTATPTTSGDFSIQNGSPVKDAGDNVLLPADEFDLDGDANTAEALPIDLIGNNRSAGVVDMGSYENQTSNQPPTLTSFSGAVDTGLEDTEVETTFADLQTAGDENDPDGTVDAFKVISVDSGTLKIGTSSGTATAYATSTNDLINESLNAYWTASANNNGATVNAFEVIAVDNEGAESSTNVMATINITAVNDAPAFTATGDVTVSEDFGTTESVTVTPSAVPSDESGQTVTYSLSPASVSFADVSINASTGEVTITAVADSVGTQLFTITADDAQGANNTHDETFTLTVNAVNDAPAFTTTGDVTVSEDFGTTETVTVTPDAVPTNESGQTVTYSLSPASVSFANVSINTSTGEVTITSVADSIGTQLFTITADDAQGANNTHDETFTLTVNAVNDAPAFTTTGDVTVSEDFGTTETVTVTPDAVPTNESGQTVTYSLSPASVSFANVSINTSTGEVTITAVADSIGTQLFTITADDGEGANNTHDETFTLTVNAVNDAPAFTTTGDVTVSEDFGTTETVTVTPDAVPTNESGQTVTYSLSPASVSFANVSINTSTGEVTITAVADSIGTQLFTITADDGEGANNTHDETFTLTVNAVNDAPSFTTTGDVTASEDFGTTESVTVTPDAVPTDELGQTVTYSLSPASVSFANVSINTSTGKVTITAVADSIGTQLFTITADDGEGANNTHDETFTLTVNAVNDDPSVDVNNGLTLDEGATLVITTSELSASDVDNISSELTYTVTTSPVNGIVVRSSDTNSAITSFTQSEVEANEILYKHDDSETTSDSFVFTIADNAGGSASGVTFNITINPVDDTAPVISSLSPLDGATGVASVGGSFEITFSENIFKGAGNVSFKRTSDNSLIGNVDVTSGAVSIVGATATISPAFNLGCDEDIYIEIGNGVFVDGNSNNFAGVAPAAWNFVTNEAPVIIPGSIIITDNTSCDVTNNGALDASNAIQLDGGASAAGNYTFQWYEGAGTGGASAGTTASISALTSGSYTLVVTHTARGCESDEVTVTLNDDFTDPPIISPSVSALTDCAANNGSVSATASSTSEPADYTFKLYAGVGTSGPILTNLVAAGNVGFTTSSLVDGNYTIEVINNSTSCDATQTVTINDARVLPTINAANVTQSNLTECGTGDGSIDISAAIEESSVVQDPADFTITWYAGSGTGGTVVGSTAAVSNLTDGVYTVEIVRNSNSCSVSAEYTLVEDDQINPTVITQDITVQLDAAGSATIATTDIDNGSSDACGIASQSLDVSSFDCSHIGTPQVVTLTVTDNNGNTNTGTATVTVADTVSATVVTQDITVQLDASGAATISTTDIDNGSSDACGIASQSLDVTSFDCSHIGTPQVVTLTVTDNNGNINTGTATVTVADTVSATVVTQDITVQLDASGAATISTTDIDNGSSDACGIASQSLDVSSFDCSHVGTPQVVTLTVTDNNGNTNTGTATVTVEDNVLPTVVTQDITVQLDAAGAATIATTDIDNGSSDACGILSQSLDVTAFDCSHIGTPQTVTLTVTDNNGNSNTGTATVTVEDNVLPMVVTQDITVQLDAAGAATIATTDIDNGSNDACGILSQSLDVTSFDCSHVGTPQTVTLTVTDNNGNSNTGTATVTVEDSVLPTVVTQDITVQLDAAGAATISTGDIDNGSSDACGIASQSLDVTSFDCSHIGTPQVVTLTVTDNNGNSNTGTATVTVEDNVLPTVVTQDITVQLDAAGAATIATTDIDNGSSDACGILSQSLDVTAFDCSHVGTPQTVTLTVTDNNGNVNTATATVTVEDSVLPTVVTQDITVQLDAAGAATIATTDIDNGSSDACGILSQSLDVTSFDCSHVGTPQTVTLTVTDNNGNVNTATATVTVEDSVLPTVVTQDITVQLDAAGAATIATTDIDNGSSDACGILSQSLDVTSFDCSHVGTPQTVTLTVTDNNGNVNTATATVTVEDSVLPTVVTQDITVQLDAAGSATIATTDIDNGSSDACGILSQSLDVTAFDCSHVGTPQTVTLTVTDNNGNANTATATVTVQDTVLPTVVTQDITVQLDASGAATIATTDIDNGSSDACGILSQSLDVTAFDCSHVGTPQTVTLTVTDNNGNVNTATATVTVEDSVLPNVVTQDITVQLDAAGSATIATTDIDNGSSDACGILSQSLDVTAFDCSHVGTPQTVTLTVTDNNGNVNTATATVTVEDSVLPNVVTQDITVQLDAAGAATIATTDIDNGSSDACGILSQSLDVTAFDCSHVGTPQTVTLTVTDNNGNVNTATTTVTVVDSVLPTVVTQDITVQLDAAGAATIATTDIDNGSSDACGILSQSLDVTAFDCSHVGTPQTVTLTVTDNNGNVNTATATVTVEDSVLPTVVTQDITVQLDAAGAATIATTDIDNGSSDNCGIASQSLDVTAFDCSHIGTPQTVTLTVTDNNGDSSTGTATVTVEDSVLPTVVTQDITVQLDATGAATIATTDIDNGSSDACGILSQSLNVTSFDCSHVGTPQTVTLTVTDNNGNVNTGTATITVQDTVLPTVIAQDITVQLDAAGAATIATTDIDNGSSDACGILSQSLDVTAFDCSHVGTPQTVTLTVTDNNGNVNTGTATVTVQDTVLPTVITQDITVQLDAAGAATIATTDIDNGSSDACGILSQSLDVISFDCSHVGTPQTVTLAVTDNNGNVNTATATVTVEDKIAPIIVAKDLEVYLDSNGRASISAIDLDNGSSDGCGSIAFTASQTEFSCQSNESKSLEFDKIDDYLSVASGGDVFSSRSRWTFEAWVNIPDSGNTINQQTYTLMSVPGTSAVIVIFSTGLIQIRDHTNTGSFQSEMGQYPFDSTWHHLAIANNGSGGTGVIYLDGQPVSLANNNFLTWAEMSGMEMMVGSWNNHEASFFKGQLDEVRFWSTYRTQEEIQVNMRARLSGSEDGLELYYDFENANGNVIEDASGNSYEAVMTNMEISNLSETNSPVNESSFFDVILTVTDESNNSSSTQVKVQLIDSIAPTAATKDITIYLNNNGIAEISPDDVDNGSSDACNNVELSLDKSTFNCNDIGEQVIELTVTDKAGNTSTQNAFVTVSDTLDPVFAVHNVTVILDAMGNGSLALNDVVTSQEDCLSLSLSRTTFDCADPESVEIEVTGVDAGGNETIKTVIVTVDDSTPKPVFNIVSDASVQCDGGSVTLLPVHAVSGSAIRFGPGGHAVTNHADELNMDKTSAFTIEAWIRPERTQRGTILSKMLINGPYTGYELYYENGRIGYHLIEHWTGSTMYGVTNTNIPPGQWHHVAMAYDGNSVTLYVNGTKASQQLIINRLNGSMANTVGLFLGTRGGTQFPFVGSMDEVRLWDHARSASQISKLKDARIDRNFKGLLAYYDFENVADSEIIDKSIWDHTMIPKGSFSIVGRSEMAIDTVNYSYEFDGSIAQSTSNRAASFENKNYISFKNSTLDAGSIGSIEMRVKWNGLQDQGYGRLFGAIFGRQRNGAYSNAVLGLNHQDPNQARMVWRPYNGSQNVITSSVTLDNNWHHVVITYGNGSHKMYIDGALVGSANINGRFRKDPYTPFTLGAWSGQGDSYSSTFIDDLRVWKIALSDTQVNEVLNDFDLASQNKNLGLYHDFESYSGNQLITDKSGSEAPSKVVGGLNLVTREVPVNVQSNLFASYNLSIAQQGYQRIKVTDKETGCVAIDSIFIDLGTNPKPHIKPLRNPLYCGTNANVPLVISNSGGQGVLGIQWYRDGYKIEGASSSTYTATTSGKYAVEVINSLGCPGLSDVIEVRSNQPTGKIEGEFKQLMCGNTHTIKVKHENAVLFRVEWYDNRYRRWVNYSGVTQSDEFEVRHAGYYRVMMRSSSGCISYTSNIALYKSYTYHAYISDINRRAFPQEVINGKRQSFTFVGQQMRSYYGYSLSQVDYTWEREGEIVGEGYYYTPETAGTHRLVLTDKRSGCEFKSAIIEVYNGPSVTLQNLSNTTELCGNSIRLKADFDVELDQWKDISWTWLINGREYRNPSQELAIGNPGAYQIRMRYKGQSVLSNLIRITNPSIRIYPSVKNIEYCPGRPLVNGKISDRFKEENISKGASYYWYAYFRGRWNLVGQNTTGELEVRRQGYYGFRAKTKCGTVSRFVYYPVRMSYCGRNRQVETPIDTTLTETISELSNVDKIEIYGELETMVHVEMSPQPVADIANIKIVYNTDDLAENVEIKLFDLTGKWLTTKPLNDVYAGYSESEIDVSDMSDGVYLYRIESANGSIHNGRFIITR